MAVMETIMILPLGSINIHSNIIFTVILSLDGYCAIVFLFGYLLSLIFPASCLRQLVSRSVCDYLNSEHLLFVSDTVNW